MATKPIQKTVAFLSILGVVLPAVVLGAGFAAAGTINVGSDKQLFIGPWAEDGRDEYLVESMKNVTMTMNQAHVTGERLMEATRPWEQPDMCVGNFVIKDGDIFRMYYCALPKSTEQGPHTAILCYAESKDGIHWTKPNLGLCEWEGSRENNILFPNDDFKYVFSYACPPPVFIDPAAESPDEKYKMFMKVTPWEKTEDVSMKSLPKAQYAFCSPDGLRWKLATEKRVNPRGTDTQFSVFWDERVGQYVGYTRVKPVDEAQIKFYQQRYGFEGRRKVRGVGRMVSDDFRNWSGETAVIFPDEIDRANSPPGLKRLDFYGGNISKYTEAPNIYLSLLTAFSHWGFDLAKRTKDKSGRWSGGEFPATMDVQLATSRDGIHWNRTPRRRPFIRLGPEGSFWSKMIFPCASVIRVGDELWIYFTAARHSHSEAGKGWEFSRAVLRLDGFISADAAYTGGELTTKPLIFTGRKLQLNVTTGAGGTVQVEIQDQARKPIGGFTVDDADEINGNYMRVPASWKSSTDVSSLAGRPIRLRFTMRDAKLYSFQFVP